jgi:hypothetical protein
MEPAGPCLYPRGYIPRTRAPRSTPQVRVGPGGRPWHALCPRIEYHAYLHRSGGETALASSDPLQLVIMQIHRSNGSFAGPPLPVPGWPERKGG